MGSMKSHYISVLALLLAGSCREYEVEMCEVRSIFTKKNTHNVKIQVWNVISKIPISLNRHHDQHLN
jgi:hypothetical protein